MTYTTKELRKDGLTAYHIRKRLKNGQLFLLQRGLYSDTQATCLNESDISKKYPSAIFTGLSAFYLYGLTDHIPDYFYLATEQHSFPIRKDDIAQSYQNSEFFSVGVTELHFDNGLVKIYDLERLLIELVRLKEKYPKEIYYEVLNSFRTKRDELDFYKVNQYLKAFPRSQNLLNKIKEVI